MDNLRYIASWSFLPYISKPRWPSATLFLLAAKAALRSVNSVLGKKPIVYTDHIGLKVFKHLDVNAEFINMHDDLLTNGNPKYFAFSKLNTYLVQTEPFVHFDLDIMFNRNFEHRYIDYDIVGMCPEEVTDTNQRCGTHEFVYVNNEINSKYQLTGPFNVDSLSGIPVPNCSVLYMRDMDFLQKYVIESKRVYTQNTDIEDITYCWDAIAEQQVLGILAKRHNMRIDYLLHDWPEVPEERAKFITTFNGEFFKNNRSSQAFLYRYFYDCDIENAERSLADILVNYKR